MKHYLSISEKDGVWDSSYVSTGVYDQTGVNDVLGGSSSALGNGETGYGYAIKGVEFSYLKVADIVQFSESETNNRTDSHVEVLYAIDKTKGADFLKALNLADGKDRYGIDLTKVFNDGQGDFQNVEFMGNPRIHGGRNKNHLPKRCGCHQDSAGERHDYPVYLPPIRIRRTAALSCVLRKSVKQKG